jgi:hypothetical protein
MLALTGTALTALVAGCDDVSNSGTPTETQRTSAGDDPTDSPAPSVPATETPTPDPVTETSTPGSDPGESLENGSFEADWIAWTIGRHLPDDPNRPPGRKVASEAGVSTRHATDGTRACRLYIDGKQDDGTVWVQQSVDLSDAEYLAVDYRVSESINEIRIAATYTGPVPDEPLTETDFDTERPLEGHDRPGWKTFTYEVTHDGPGLVAVGFTIVWETGAEVFLDDVRLTTDPPTTVTPTADRS